MASLPPDGGWPARNHQEWDPVSTHPIGRGLTALWSDRKQFLKSSITEGTALQVFLDFLVQSQGARSLGSYISKRQGGPQHGRWRSAWTGWERDQCVARREHPYPFFSQWLAPGKAVSAQPDFSFSKKNQKSTLWLEISFLNVDLCSESSQTPHCPC